MESGIEQDVLASMTLRSLPMVFTARIVYPQSNLMRGTSFLEAALLTIVGGERARQASQAFSTRAIAPEGAVDASRRSG